MHRRPKDPSDPSAEHPAKLLCLWEGETGKRFCCWRSFGLDTPPSVWFPDGEGGKEVCRKAVSVLWVSRTKPEPGRGQCVLGDVQIADFEGEGPGRDEMHPPPHPVVEPLRNPFHWHPRPDLLSASYTQETGSKTSGVHPRSSPSTYPFISIPLLLPRSHRTPSHLNLHVSPPPWPPGPGHVDLPCGSAHPGFILYLPCSAMVSDSSSCRKRLGSLAGGESHLSQSSFPTLSSTRSSINLRRHLKMACSPFPDSTFALRYHLPPPTPKFE